MEEVRIKSNVKVLCDSRNWDQKDFLGEAVKAGLSIDTGKKLYRGSTSLQLSTAFILLQIFNLESLDKLFEYDLEKV